MSEAPSISVALTQAKALREEATRLVYDAADCDFVGFYGLSETDVGLTAVSVSVHGILEASNFVNRLMEYAPTVPTDISSPTLAERTRFVTPDEVFGEGIRDCEFNDKVFYASGVHHCGRLLVFDGQNYVGLIGNVRAKGAPAHSRRERIRLNKVVPQASKRLIAASRLEAFTTPIVLVLDEQHHVQWASKTGEHALHLGVLDWLAKGGLHKRRTPSHASWTYTATPLHGKDSAAGATLLHVHPVVHPQLALSAQLTPRQRQVAELIAHGLSNKEIAHELDISPETCASHVKKVYAVLDCRSRVDLVRLLTM